MDGVPKILAALDDYELRHLPTHLAGGDLDDDLHGLLALASESPKGLQNAWFAAKEAIGDDQGYTADIALAAQRAAEKAASAVAAGKPAVEVGLELRYALMSAARVTMTEDLPGEFLVEMVKAGRWSAAYALANARRHQDAHTRGRALALLSDLLGGGERRRALEDGLASAAELDPDAQDDKLENERTDVLVLLAARLPDDLLPRAFSLAREIENTSGRCRSLSALARRLDNSEQRTVVREILGSFDSGAASASSAFELLGDIVSDDLGEELVEKARSIGHPYQRCAALVTILDRLSPAARSAVIDEIKAESGLDHDQRLQLLARAGRHLTQEQVREVVAAIPSVSWDSARLELWAALLPVIPAEERAAAFEAAMRDADGIDPEGHQYAVESVATILPCVPPGERRDSLLAAGLNALADTQPNAKQQVLARLTPFLVPGLLDSALESVRSTFEREEYFWSLNARVLIAFGKVDRKALGPGGLARILKRARQMKSSENQQYVLEAAARSGVAPLQTEGASVTAASDAAHSPKRTSVVKRWAAKLPRRSAGEPSTLLARWRETENSSILDVLASRLKTDLGRDAIEVARSGGDLFRTGRLLTQLVGYLNRQDQEMTADAILALGERPAAIFADSIVDIISADRVAAAVATAQGFADRIEGAQLVSRLMRRLEGSDAERALDFMIDAAEPEEEYRDMLSWYAELFCNRLSPAQAARIEGIARLRNSPEREFDTLLALLPRRRGAEGHECLMEMLWVAWRISSYSDRRDRIAKIMSEFVSFPRAELLNMWRAMLRKLSMRRREEALADLAALAPVVSTLGGSGAVRESVRAIGDVSTWWP